MLVPGERRRRAAGHFLRAGVEVLRGARELARPARTPEGAETGRRGGRRGQRRERIEIE